MSIIAAGLACVIINALGMSTYASALFLSAAGSRVKIDVYDDILQHHKRSPELSAYLAGLIDRYPIAPFIIPLKYFEYAML